MKFSQRKGLTPVSQIIQVEGMSDELRNSIWNTLDILVWKSEEFMYSQYGTPSMHDFSHSLWFHFYKLPADKRPEHAYQILAVIRKSFFEAEWFEVYDLLEYIVSSLDERFKLEEGLNVVFESELAGYRFIDGKVVDITDKQEVEMLENALSDSKFGGAAAHLKRALELFGDRKSPDYRNSIKESISAVESVARAIAGTPKATLGEALKALDKKKAIHPALKDGFLKIYGYTSDAEGIRHAMLLDGSVVTQADARFMLLSCTSFVNYLKAQVARA